MAQSVTWYLTDVSRTNGSLPWVRQSASVQVKVWFGEQTEWNALSAAQKSQYQIYIIDEPGGAELVDAAEMRAAMSRYNGTYQFPNSAGFLGTQNIDDDGFSSTPLVPSVGVAVDSGAIESAKKAVLITLDPITAPTVPDGYKGGVAHFKPFRPGKLTPPCFTRGTMIRTPFGDRPIETLRVGDLVMTADHGPQPIALLLSVRLDGPRLAADPHLRPIRIRKGALGQNMPEADLLVSPQHRILVHSKISLRMFGSVETLVAAKHLLSIDGIELAEDCDSVEYFHMLLPCHEIVFAHGARTESLYTGEEALNRLGAAARAEIFALFPQLEEGRAPVIPARPLVLGRRGRQFARRHSDKHLALFV